MIRTIHFRWLGAAVLAACAAQPAAAGSFFIREQSAEALGQAYAGVAAGNGGLSSMFWNPATLTQKPGVWTSFVATGIFPTADITAQPGTAPFLLPLGNAGNTAPSALLPALYGSFQAGERLWFGLSVNAPYGLASKPNNPASSQLYGLKSWMKSAEIAPSAAYKINDMVSIGASVRFLNLKLYQQTALAPFPGSPLLVMRSGAWGAGYRLGITVTPWSGTTLGLAYNSRIDVDTRGTMSFPIPLGPIPPGAYGIGLKIVTPESVNIGLRQQITRDFAMSATWEWTHWSQLKASAIVGSPIPGQIAPFFYRDGWMAALGGEYRWSDALTLRAGVSYEQSPISTRIREVRNPDTNRKSLTAGLTYRFTEKLSLDAAYSVSLPGHAKINILPGNPTFATAGVPFVGDVAGQLHLLSVGLNYRWDSARSAGVVAKY
ncbi:MAG: OmpP1/FadL family transporter [Beijerinckiaceae bacterium]